MYRKFLENFVFVSHCEKRKNLWMHTWPKVCFNRRWRLERNGWGLLTLKYIPAKYARTEAMNSRAMQRNCIPLAPPTPNSTLSHPWYLVRTPRTRCCTQPATTNFPWFLFLFSGTASIERAATSRSHGDESRHRRQAQGYYVSQNLHSKARERQVSVCLATMILSQLGELSWQRSPKRSGRKIIAGLFVARRRKVTCS